MNKEKELSRKTECTTARSSKRSQVKEYNYVLRLLPEDLAVLDKYRGEIVAGTSGFAEIYYNFMFDNPDIRERMVVNGTMADKEVFVKNHQTLSILIDEHLSDGGEAPTFFEVMFLMALVYFREAEVDVMVIEAGIGGRYDTTNVLEHRWLNVLTSIGLDHVGILGDTLEAIVKDKAWVMREGVLTVALIENKTVLEGIRRVAKEKKANFLSIEPFSGNILERAQGSIDFSLDTKYYNYERLRISANASYQLTNAKLAIEAVHQLSDKITLDTEKVAEGVRRFYWPGRLEYVEEWLLVDGAHNADGVKAFADYMNSLGDEKELDLLFACMSDKEHKQMCQLMLTIGQLRNIYLPRLPYPMAVKAETMVKTFQGLGFNQVSIVNDIEDFLKTKASKVGTRTLLGAVGSLYLVGAVKKYRGGLDNDQF